MDKFVEITCDACGKDFKIDAKSIHFRQSGDLLFRYFVCPECNSAYLISVTDKEFRKQLNKGRMNAKQHARIQEIMNERYYPRFKELFPSAFKKEQAENE